MQCVKCIMLAATTAFLASANEKCEWKIVSHNHTKPDLAHQHQHQHQHLYARTTRRKKNAKVETKRAREEEKYVGTCSRSIQSCQSIAWQRIGHCVHTMPGWWSRSTNDIEQYTHNTFVGNHIVYSHNECIIGCRYAGNLFDLHWFWFWMDKH